MRNRYLELTFRAGKPIAGYLYLPRETGDTSVRTAKHSETLLVDYAADGRPIGVEILDPTHLTLTDLNLALAAIGQPPLTAQEFAPLAAA